MGDASLAISALRTPRPEPVRLHARLAMFNRDRLTPALPDADGHRQIAAEREQVRLELEFISDERRAVAARAAQAPRDPAGFVAWFEDLKASGPGQGDALFPWLAEQASRSDIRWFVKQEAAGEAGFEDLTALAQLKLPPRPKLEMARNFWDEMGRGGEKGMHGPMLARLVQALDIDALPDPLVWQTLALGNLMMAFAVNRFYRYHAIGALGVIELTAPTRAIHVARALKRLGLSAAERHYFDLHAVLDLHHSAQWNQEVLAPLVAERPDCAAALAEGALMRLTAGARCFQRYREHFGLA